MKKDEQWLKNMLKNEQYYTESKEKEKVPFGELYERGVRGGLGKALELAEELDEPEKVVIPKFVAEWIEVEKAGYTDKYLILEMFMCEYNAVELPNDLYNYYDNNKGNSRDKVINAILNGYEVEKEKRYYIIDKTNNSTLMTFELSDVVGEEIIEFVYGYSENETIHFNSKEKAELIAHFVGESLEVEEVTE